MAGLHDRMRADKDLVEKVAGQTGQPVLGPPMPEEEARAIIARGR